MGLCLVQSEANGSLKIATNFRKLTFKEFL